MLPESLAFEVGPSSSDSSFPEAIMVQAFFGRLAGQGGQGLPEYALIMGLVGVVAMAALTFLGESISGLLSTLGAAI
jgi:hypothetical protein